MKPIPLSLMLWLGCSGPAEVTDSDPVVTDTVTTPTGTSGDTGEPDVPGPDLVVTEGNNYTYSVGWTFPSFPVRGQFDITVDWSDTTEDAWGIGRSPTSYDTAFLFEVNANATTFLDKWNIDDLNGGGKIGGLYTGSITNRSNIRLASLLDVGGDNFDTNAFFRESGTRTWLFGVGDDDLRRVDLRLGLILVPLTAGTESRVDLADGQSSVTWSAALDGVPLRTSEVHDRFSALWRAVDTTAYGTEYDRFLADRLFIGQFPKDTTTEALAASVHDLAPLADRWWTADIEGDNSILLELARDADSVNFGGFEAGSVWVLSARCSTCFGAAPWWLTTVEVE